MSREAISYVLRNSDTEDGSRLIMLCLAHRSPRTSVPFIAKASAADLAKDTRLAHRYVQERLKGLEADGELVLLLPGRGRRPNKYEIQCRSYVSHLVATDLSTS